MTTGGSRDGGTPTRAGSPPAQIATDAGAPDGADRDACEVAPDGSPVAVYAALPVEPEFSPVLAHLRPGWSVLDLGCGAGRLANELARRGHTVVGVDECRAMLARLAPGIRPVEARIEELALGARFDVVVLASYLVNVPGRGRRRGLLEACARHVEDSGGVLLARYDPDWARRLTRERTRVGGVGVTLEVRGRRGPLLSLRTVLALSGRRFRQEHTARILDDDELAEELGAVGLELTGRLDPWWVVARPDGSYR